MPNNEPEPFAPAVTRWVEGLGGIRDVVRQELVARQLHRHLPAADGGAEVRVLDIGCGQGTQAIRLASDGYHVTGVDPSPDLLELARAATASEPADVRRMLTWRQGDLFDLAELGPDSWDVVCCHGVVMYLPSLAEAVRAIVAMARPGGLVSILSRNQAGIAMRAGMTGRWQAAVEGFDADHYTNRLGVVGARADRASDVRARLVEADAEVVAWYGVRLFTDHWEHLAPRVDESSNSHGPADLVKSAAQVHPDDPHAAERSEPPQATATSFPLDDLLEAEDQAGQRDPYRQLAALTHTLARKRGAAFAGGPAPAKQASP
ncbi:MAG: class I SAM-dependent methyltransferase [Nocardioidaceae bacterium]